MYWASTKDVCDTITYDFGSPTRWLSISASSGGTTNPIPGTYVYNYGESATVTATADSGHPFLYWILDGAKRYENPITITMDSDHTLQANFKMGVGGFVTPADRFSLLTPYIGLTSAIVIATVAAAVYVKHVKQRKERR